MDSRGHPAGPDAVNRVELSGELVKLEPVRYTPAGVPVSKLIIEHRSQQPEADHYKRVQCQVTVQAQGQAHQTVVERLRVGDLLLVRGFLQRNAYREDQSWLKIQALSIERVGQSRSELASGLESMVIK